MTPPSDLPLSKNGLEAYWMPFTGNRHFKRHPRVLVAAEGMYYTRDDGERILDGVAGLWCVNAGHGRTAIAEAIAAQAKELDYSPAFQAGHPRAFELAARLADMLPGDLDHVFFTNSGSESVETALKIALAYHRHRGEESRRVLVGRERGYHGVNFGGLSVSGIPANKEDFGPLLPQVDLLPHTHDPDHNAFSKGEPGWGGHLADILEEMVAKHGERAIAAVMVEPVAGSTGVLVPPQGYLKRLREICDNHGILLIFDEVITGFGRLGSAFACEKFGVLPDMVTLAKGLTNGTAPMGAVAAREGIYETFMDAADPDTAIEFAHGYTYSGHPLACAAALAAQDIYRNEDLFARACELAPYWEEAVHSLGNLPHVTDIRNMGLMAGIELDPIPERPTARAFDIYLRAFEKGLLIRTTGDIIALSPPLIVERHEVDRMMEILATLLKQAV
jgi:beta-alanine--pyruvate transaminase